jgi:hypothetical protein
MLERFKWIWVLSPSIAPDYTTVNGSTGFGAWAIFVFKKPPLCRDIIETPQEQVFDSIPFVYSTYNYGWAVEYG